MVYLYIFFIALISGSLVPLGSEAFLIYYVSSGFNIYALFISATIGNVLGSLINYYLGLKGEQFLLRKKLLNKNSLNSAKKRFNKYGAYALLFSALPIIGDPLTFIAGVLEYNKVKFIIFVTISKAFRYILIILVYGHL